MFRHKGFIFNLLLLLAVISCQKVGVEAKRVPMSFSANTSDIYLWDDDTQSEETKASSDPLVKAGRKSFKVWATSVGESNVTIMDGYRVNFDEQNEEWTYTSGDGTTGQSNKFWYPGATEHRFHAGAPANMVSSMTGNSVTFDIQATNKGSLLPLVSKPVEITNSSNKYGEPVLLNFSYAMCFVVLQFKFKNPKSEQVVLNDLTLTPSQPSSSPFPKSGKLTFTHDWSTSPVTTTYSLSDIEYGSTAYSANYGNVTIPANSTNYVNPQSNWYMLPCKMAWKVNVYWNGALNSIGIPADKADWKPGYKYRYQFNVSDQIELRNVSVEAWTPETINVVIE